MEAVVLAGGKGTRLRPYTTAIPKPLVPIGDQFSILDVILFQLADAGFRKIWLPIGHLGHLIRSFVGTGERWGLEVVVVEERDPLGTIGPLLPILDQLPEEFLVMNGDILTDLDYAELLAAHRTGAPSGLSVATYGRTTRIDFGVLDVEDGRVVGFREKPALEVQVSMGVYALSREALRRFPVGRPLGFDQLVLDLLARGEHPTSFLFEGFWLDIGRPEDYDRANDEADELLARLVPGYHNLVQQQRVGTPMVALGTPPRVDLPVDRRTARVGA